jgi:hypothetical protein
MADLSDPTFWIPTIVSVAGLLLVYVDMRRRQQSDREASKLMFDLISTMRDELQLLKQQMGNSGLTTQQALLQKQEQAQWKRLTDVAKGIAWLWKKMEQGEE